MSCLYFPNSGTARGGGSSWFYKDSGVWITFFSKAVPEPKLITCSLWRYSAVSPPLESDETLVSNVIELSCDDPDGVIFSEISVALSHSVSDVPGHELVMKELVDRENKTWKDLKTIKESLIVQTQSGMLLFIKEIKSTCLRKTGKERIKGLSCSLP